METRLDTASRHYYSYESYGSLSHGSYWQHALDMSITLTISRSGLKVSQVNEMSM